MQFCLISPFSSFLFLFSSFVLVFFFLLLFFSTGPSQFAAYTLALVLSPVFTTELITHLYVYLFFFSLPLLLKSSQTSTPPFPSFVNNPYLLHFKSVWISWPPLDIRFLLLDGPLGHIQLMAPPLYTMFHSVLRYPSKPTAALLR